MIEKHFDVAFIGDMALREKQVQQIYRPIIAVHKWFARRPGTAFMAPRECVRYARVSTYV